MTESIIATLLSVITLMAIVSLLYLGSTIFKKPSDEIKCRDHIDIEDDGVEVN